MSLEDQLESLEPFGVRLRPDLRPDDLVEEREWYELRPYGMLGSIAQRREWDASALPVDALTPRFGLQDTEMVDSADSYPDFVRAAARIAGTSGRLGRVDATFDEQARTCELVVELDGVEQQWFPEVRGDWADGAVLLELLEELGPPGKALAMAFTGQHVLYTWLDPDATEPFERLVQPWFDAPDPVVVAAHHAARQSREHPTRGLVVLKGALALIPAFIVWVTTFGSRSLTGSRALDLVLLAALTFLVLEVLLRWSSRRVRARAAPPL